MLWPFPAPLRPFCDLLMSLPRLTHRSFPIALAAAVILGFGVFIPWFGFYGDDWLYIYTYHVLGPGSFPAFVAADRPFSGWVYTLVTPILGESPLGYHLLLLVLRWGSGMLLWWVLRLVWPNEERKLGWAALLFVLFPGFQQQPIAVQFILHFTILNIFLFSLGAMLKSLEPGRTAWFWRVGAWVSSLSFFSLEYFVGLELLRPVLVGLRLRQAGEPLGRRLLRRVGLHTLPFWVTLAAFGVWRALIFKFPTYQLSLMDELKVQPVQALLHLGQRVVGDVLTVTALSWRQAAVLPAGGWQNRVMMAGLVLGALALAWFYLSRWNPNPQSESGSWAGGALGLGGLALAAAGVPFWAAGVPLETSFPWDRSMLPFMLGACLVTVTLVDLFLRPGKQALVFSALLALAVGAHFNNALVYREEWQNLRAYFWQMTWRAPQLAPGTIVVSDEIPLFRFSDNDLWPVLDWTYAPQQTRRDLSYKYFDLSLRLGEDLTVEKGQMVEHSYRNLRFSGSSDSVVAVYNRKGGCLHFAAPKDKARGGLPERVRKVLPISNLKQIQDSSSAATPPDALGPQPEQDWCYYYQKADLARQMAEWTTVVDLWKEAAAQGYQAQDLVELLPFMEGFARTGDWAQAQRLSEQAAQSGDARPAVCALWKQTADNSRLSPQERSQAAELRTVVGCETE